MCGGQCIKIDDLWLKFRWELVNPNLKKIGDFNIYDQLWACNLTLMFGWCLLLISLVVRSFYDALLTYFSFWIGWGWGFLVEEEEKSSLETSSSGQHLKRQSLWERVMLSKGTASHAQNPAPKASGFLRGHSRGELGTLGTKGSDYGAKHCNLSKFSLSHLFFLMCFCNIRDLCELNLRHGLCVEELTWIWYIWCSWHMCDDEQWKL